MEKNKTEVKSNLKLEFNITLKLSLSEARALNEMVKYGSKTFLEGYYKHLGKSYLQPFESGVTSLFETVKSELPYKLHNVDKIINAVNEIKGLNPNLPIGINPNL